MKRNDFVTNVLKCNNFHCLASSEASVSKYDGDGNRYRIRAKGVPYDELRANITELIRIFEEELRGIVPQL